MFCSKCGRAENISNITLVDGSSYCRKCWDFRNMDKERKGDGVNGGERDS